MSKPSLQWYARRLGRMSPAEITWRTRDQLRRTAWSGRQVHPGQEFRPASPAAAGGRTFTAVLPAGTADAVSDDERKAVLAEADEIMAGRMTVLGFERTDLEAPDWFRDPITGRRSSPDAYAFELNHRDEEITGNVKQVWELSRHHHLTVLATAWYLSEDDRYAERVAEHLRSWWSQNPYLSGVHWTNGIEIGIRLISWVWVRRLLDGWPGVRELFEDNEQALRQIDWHQRFLSGFRSRGSSANNHVIAEAAGQLIASCAFPWFTASGRRRREAASLLVRELRLNTFQSGLNRELATDYHRLVGELGLLAAVEADAAGHALAFGTWDQLTRIVDAGAAIVDVACRPPRQGDGDDGRALLLTPSGAEDWSGMLALGGALVGPLDWWPAAEPTATSVLAAALLPRRPETSGRRSRRPDALCDAGLTILRTPAGAGEELWCRLDGGPHGFLSIAAHAHADALAAEFRVGGVDVLADPGTYCYHGEPRWRDYFRSTLAHNTLELDGVDQSASGGPFLWLRKARTRVLSLVTGAPGRARGDVVSWQAEHDGYRALAAPAWHRRSVELNRRTRRLTIEDDVVGEGRHEVRLAFHLGPEVQVRLYDDATARLEWNALDGTPRYADVVLPTSLRWSAHRGEDDPVLGWYSAGFGRKVPSWTLLGTGTVIGDTTMVTELVVDESQR